jgi:hypothetical protein
MKGMLTVGIGGPNDRFLHRITSQANGTTIGHQFPVCQFQLTRRVGGPQGVGGTGFEIVVVLFYDIRGRVFQNQIFRLDRLSKISYKKGEERSADMMSMLLERDKQTHHVTGDDCFPAGSKTTQDNRAKINVLTI